MAISKMRVGVLVSGNGSNLQALLEAAQEPNFPVEIALVISNKPNVFALGRASQAGVPQLVIDHKAYASRELFEAALHAALLAVKVELVCLAGFMRVLTPWFIECWQGRLLNIHPSLLPAFPGLHTHQAALAAGVKFAGCTVHQVVADLDAGPIIGQAIVPIMDKDTPEILAARVLQAEHQLYPLCLQKTVAILQGQAFDQSILKTNDYWLQI